jgi:PKD repeat protein
MARSLRILVAAAALAGLSSCTLHEQQDAPTPSGPSSNGTSLTVIVTPDILTQDGQSQSLVSITTYGPNGQPLANVPLRAVIVVGGAITDFGTLSARNLVTDASGRASVTYTAPAAPVINTDNGTVVGISVAPLSTDFANNNPVQATIRLMPPGVVGPPVSALRPDFTPPTATVGNPAVFQATVVDATGADATAQVNSYLWTFGDGGSASGRNATHTFTGPGSFAVSLTITDTLGRTQTTTHSLTIGQGQIPTASFVISPASPIINQNVNFNASGSVAEPGHTITTFAWNFGDGTLGDGALVTHTYQVEGTYTVTLKVTDDAGRKSSLATQTITVTTDLPIARPVASPNPASGTTGSSVQVSFDGSSSTAATGRIIVSYEWTFSNGGGFTGATGFHSFSAGSTYFATLTVKDSTGKTDTKTITVVVNGT